MTAPKTLAGAAMFGAASGARSFTGVGVLAALGSAGPQGRPAKILDHRVGRPLIMLLAAQELVMDKLPQAPNRTEWLGLGARLTSAAGCGAALALDETQPAQPIDDQVIPLPVRPRVDAPAVLAASVVAAAAAALSAWGGVRWRSLARDRFGQDWPGALLEDVASAGLAAAAWRVAHR